jgi:hypothetical protein
MPNPVEMAAGFSCGKASRIIELREVPTDPGPNDASWADASRARGAGRGVSRGPEVAPRFAEGTARGQRRGKVIARRNCPAGDHSVPAVSGSEPIPELPGGSWRPRPEMAHHDRRRCLIRNCDCNQGVRLGHCSGSVMTQPMTPLRTRPAIDLRLGDSRSRP